MTEDAEIGAVQDMLISGQPLHSLIYKGGHHGANTSRSKIFMEAVKPQYISISAGEDNKYGHPHPEMIKRAEAIGAAVLRTDVSGTIELINDGETIWSNVNVVDDKVP